MIKVWVCLCGERHAEWREPAISSSAGTLHAAPWTSNASDPRVAITAAARALGHESA